MDDLAGGGHEGRKAGVEDVGAMVAAAGGGHRRLHGMACLGAHGQAGTLPAMPVHARSPRLTRLATCLALALPTHASAQDAVPDAATLDRVQVIGAARPLSHFPGSVDVVDGADLRGGQAQVNLSEALSRVPGVTVRNRGNYAQDLQVQSRGFGARSTFGIRGLELVVDGIPASAADGQGQAANFALSSLDRIEVLRGPLALQYGNAAGGAIIGYTEPGDRQAHEVTGWVGSHRSHRSRRSHRRAPAIRGGGEAAVR